MDIDNNLLPIVPNCIGMAISGDSSIVKKILNSIPKKINILLRFHPTQNEKSIKKLIKEFCRLSLKINYSIPKENSLEEFFQP